MTLLFVGNRVIRRNKTLVRLTLKVVDTGR